MSRSGPSSGRRLALDTKIEPDEAGTDPYLIVNDKRYESGGLPLSFA